MAFFLDLASQHTAIFFRVRIHHKLSVYLALLVPTHDLLIKTVSKHLCQCQLTFIHQIKDENVASFTNGKPGKLQLPYGYVYIYQDSQVSKGDSLSSRAVYCH